VIDSQKWVTLLYNDPKKKDEKANHGSQNTTQENYD
jgi:hypothetical protein